MNGGMTRSFALWRFLFFISLSLLCFLPLTANAVSLDPYPVYDGFHDETSISFFREERPSFYWVNTGVPDVFFNGVTQTSGNPTNEVYSVNGIEYGIRLSHWIDDHWRVTGTLPFEANAMVDASGNTHTSDRIGDVEVGMTYLLTGVRQKGNFAGVDGWYRFATGTNPFTQTYPLLASGRGAASEAIGVVLGQRLWNEFSFYESFHYENTQPLQIDASNSAGLPAGTFQWPENIEAEGRIEWDVLQRAHRLVSLFFQYSMRMGGLMTLNNQAITYGQSFQLNGSGQAIPVGTTSQLFWDTGGAVFQVDQEFTAEVDVSYFPAYFIQQTQSIPNSGLLLSMSLIFRPF